MSEKRLIDGHGYEIMGMKPAKTKAQQIKALEAHLAFLEMHHIEVYQSIEREINLLKYPEATQ